jgi:hypothetical protein
MSTRFSTQKLVTETLQNVIRFKITLTVNLRAENSTILPVLGLLKVDILFIFSFNTDLWNNILGQYPLQQCCFQNAEKDY